MQVRFSDAQSAYLSHQTLLANHVEVNFIKKVKGVSKGLEATPIRTSAIFRNNLKPKRMQSPFDDANIELTFNLLKIRPEEEVRGETQTNYAFFEELSSNSKLQ